MGGYLAGSVTRTIKDLKEELQTVWVPRKMEKKKLEIVLDQVTAM